MNTNLPQIHPEPRRWLPKVLTTPKMYRQSRYRKLGSDVDFYHIGFALSLRRETDTTLLTTRLTPNTSTRSREYPAAARTARG